MKKENKIISAIDLFCGIGGLSYGLKKAGIKIKAGIDQDITCKYAFESNNIADFIGEDISKIKGQDLIEKYWNNDEVKILAGCAPCQPFSAHSNKIKGKEENIKWNLLLEFKRLIKEANPHIVSMENVPNLSNKNVFKVFTDFLKNEGFFVTYSNVFCPDYGIPQNRRRLVLLASKYGKIELINKTHTAENYNTTKDTIGMLEPIKPGEKSEIDPLHRTIKLSEINLKRIKASKPNGTWLDWDEELRLNCHKRLTGNTYKSVYGRMAWNQPSPTITTQFYNYGTGRFGHPEQDRALTIREAALLQTFPQSYIFYKNLDEVSISNLGVHIGNAVPVDLGYIIGKSIISHLNKFNKT